MASEHPSSSFTDQAFELSIDGQTISKMSAPGSQDLKETVGLRLQKVCGLRIRCVDAVFETL